MESVREWIFSAICHSIVGAGSDDHSDRAANHGDECSDQEGDCGPPLELGDQTDDNEHDGDEDEAYDILFLEKRFGSGWNFMSQVKKESFLFGGDGWFWVFATIVGIFLEIDFLNFVDVDYGPYQAYQAASSDNNDLDGVA